MDKDLWGGRDFFFTEVRIEIYILAICPHSLLQGLYEAKLLLNAWQRLIIHIVCPPRAFGPFIFWVGGLQGSSRNAIKGCPTGELLLIVVVDRDSSCGTPGK